MNSKFPLILIILILTVTAQAQSVVVTSKKVTYTRKQPVSEYKKTFSVNYPTIRASTPSLSKKIEAAISYKSVLGLDINEELSETQWLEEADYDVGYNKNGILSIGLSMDGSGAYPSRSVKTAVVDLGTGKRVHAADVFVNLAGLTTMVRKSLQKEIADAITEIKQDPENLDPHPEDNFKDAAYKIEDLDAFFVTDKMVVFTYDYGFAHAFQAMQPPGNFAFTWSQLRPFIKRRGLFGRFIR